MRFSAMMGLVFLTAVALGGCNEGAAPDEDTNAARGAEADVAVTNEQGSGTYAADCTKMDGRFAITLNRGADGMTSATVVHGGKTYDQLLTSYSYMGKNTPEDFHVAVMFDNTNAPIPVDAESTRLEIWKGEAAFYTLVNGDKAKHLMFCF